jgi:hypothetical protein
MTKGFVPIQMHHHQSSGKFVFNMLQGHVVDDVTLVSNGLVREAQCMRNLPANKAPSWVPNQTFLSTVFDGKAPEFERINSHSRIKMPHICPQSGASPSRKVGKKVDVKPKDRRRQAS